ncbi:MAG TPA: 1-acyl-sn-glycerol-3-phosphate acyltransferase, partial [Mycobacterium sp.]|nr:1-acyl-sn-glycerol-3-phosphate acyltransferase [Mycobacterium sp.]
GEPIEPTLAIEELNGLLHSRMQHLLERAQELYGPHPAGEFWVPHRLGGGAPSLAEAARWDAEDAAARAALRSQAAGPPEQ